MYESDPALLATWLTVEQAAQAYGLSTRTIRRRLSSGELAAGQLKTRNGREWRIRPPPGAEAATGASHGTPGAATGSESGDGGALVPLARVEALLAPIVEERDRLREEVNRLQEARVGDANAANAARLAQSRADAETIGRLQGRMEALEAELERLRSAEAPSAPAAAPTARRRWPWQRS